MARLVGAWRGPGLGGTADEVWLPAVGDAMTGSFRLSVEDAAVFYELWTLREIDGSLALEEDGAFFGGLTYRRLGADTLEIWVAI